LVGGSKCATYSCMEGFMVTKAISSAQVKVIYTLGNELGLVDKMASVDGLHEMVYSMVQKEKVSKLTSAEAIMIIDRLKGHMKGSSRMRYSPPPTFAEGMASEGKIKKIWALLYKLKKIDSGEFKSITLNQRLRGFLKKYASIDDIRFLTEEKAFSVIEGLKGLIRTEEKKAEKEIGK